MRHKYPYIIILLVLVASVYLVLLNGPSVQKTSETISPSPTQQTQEFSASFFIITNGIQRNFSNSMYHNLSTDVFITELNPYTVYVKKRNIQWKDFFSTLPMGLSSSCLTTGTGQTFCDGDSASSQSAQIQSLSFILNGKIQPNSLENTINPGDILLINFGTDSESQLLQKFQNLEGQVASASANTQEE